MHVVEPMHTADAALMLAQGVDAAGGGTDWDAIAPWLRTLGGAVLLCFENAEEPLRASIAQVRFQSMQCLMIRTNAKSPKLQPCKAVTARADDHAWVCVRVCPAAWTGNWQGILPPSCRHAR